MLDPKWINKLQEWKRKWPIFNKNQEDDTHGINLYNFVKILNQNLKIDSVIVSDAGSSFYVVAQAISLSSQQRWIVSCSQAELGSALPIATGVSFARNNKDVIVIVGDGSIQTNLSHLAVIQYHKLPIKIFVWNNNGYLTNKNTQTKFFQNRIIGADAKTGLLFPDLKKIADAYGIFYQKLITNQEIQQNIQSILNRKDSFICEIQCQENQEIIPTAHGIRGKNGKLIPLPLSQMYPEISKIEKEMLN